MTRYRVIGNHTQDGAEPGGTIDIEDERRARRLTRAGHIELNAHECEVCGRTFDSARGLATHERTHEEHE